MGECEAVIEGDDDVDEREGETVVTVTLFIGSLDP